MRVKAYKYGKGDLVQLIEPNNLEYKRLRRTGQKKTQQRIPNVILKIEGPSLKNQNHKQMLSRATESP